MSSPRSCDSLDLRLAAVHEASHLVLVRMFGGVGTARLWRNSSEDPAQRTWLGECTVLAAPGEIKFARGARAVSSLRRAPKLWRTYVGCAGFVGELRARQRLDLRTLQLDFQQGVRCAAVSASDIALIGSTECQRRHLVTTATYVERWWGDIERQATALEDTCFEMPSSERM